MPVNQDEIRLVHEIAFNQLGGTSLTIEQSVRDGLAQIAAAHTFVEARHGVLSRQQLFNELRSD